MKTLSKSLSKDKKILKEPIENLIINSVKAATSVEDPFSHFSMKNIFPKEIYRSILNSLPDVEDYDNLCHPDAVLDAEKKISTRKQFILNAKNIKKLPFKKRRFWSQLLPLLLSENLKLAVFDKLSKDLTHRFGVGFRNIMLHTVPILYRDEKQYKILPHTDTQNKLATFQIYLPDDEEHENLGTCLYKQKGDDFEKVKQFSYLPNMGYSFAVSHNSWHGVETIKENYVRNSLLVIYYLTII